MKNTVLKQILSPISLAGTSKKPTVERRRNRNRRTEDRLIEKLKRGLSESNEKLKTSIQKFIEVNKQLVSKTEELERAKAKDEAVLSAIGEGMIVTDVNKKIVRVNAAATEMLGFTAQDLLGQDFLSIVEAQDEKGNAIPIQRRAINKTISTGKKNINTSEYYVRKDGTRMPVAVIFNPVFFNKKIIGSVNVFRDISREIEVDRAKDEFVSLASHQLRTPLSSIGWYTEMLLAGDAGEISEQQKEYLNYIYQSNQRLAQLVNDLLNVSKIELGVLGLELEKVNLIEIADKVFDDLVPRIKMKNLKIDKEYDPGFTTINADPRLMQIILQNLLSNAIKYTPENGKVGLKMEKKDKDILIAVSDTGYGIPKDQQSQIFIKLFRAQNIKDKEPDGTGLGLYIVKSAIERSAGKIRFESEEDKGTTFYITLPCNC